VKVAPKQFDMGKLTAPKTVPKEIKMIVESEEPPSAAGVIGGIPGGVAGGALSGILGGAGIAPPPPPPPPKPKAPTAPVRIGGNVIQANLIKQPKPIYPPLAKAARVQGTVKFQATISKDGTIQNLQLLGGPPLLVQAALQAVQQWVYKPTLLNGEPVEVITTIDVNFTLSQ
jgi:protein TonB